MLRTRSSHSIFAVDHHTRLIGMSQYNGSQENDRHSLSSYGRTDIVLPVPFHHAAILSLIRSSQPNEDILVFPKSRCRLSTPRLVPWRFDSPMCASCLEPKTLTPERLTCVRVCVRCKPDNHPPMVASVFHIDVQVLVCSDRSGSGCVCRCQLSIVG
jgi:hypothetical protein